jgi:gluconokinase
LNGSGCTEAAKSTQWPSGNLGIDAIVGTSGQVGRILHKPRQVLRIAVVMGISGSGKSTVGRALADRLGWDYQEGDRLHPPANVAKMSAGYPLDDADRAPWLAAVAATIDGWRGAGKAGIVTCSALKRRYREILIGDRDGVGLVYLAGSRELIAERLAARRGHFMPAALLDSQFAALEPPDADERPIVVSAELPVDAIVDHLVTVLSPSRATIPARP